MNHFSRWCLVCLTRVCGTCCSAGNFAMSLDIKTVYVCVRVCMHAYVGFFYLYANYST